MQSHLAGGEPAYVEQVLHEAGEVLDLPIDDGASTLTRRLLRLRVLQDSAGVGDGPEGIAQLMPEHGEELVLRAVRPLRLLIELRVGHGDRRVMGIGGDERDVVRREGAAEERSHEEGPGDVSLDHEGNGETGTMRGGFDAGTHLRGVPDAGVLEDIVADNRFALVHGEPHEARAPRQGDIGIEVGATRAPAGAKDQTIRGDVEPEYRGDVGLEQGARVLGNVSKRGIEIEGIDGLHDTRQALGFPLALARVVVGIFQLRRLRALARVLDFRSAPARRIPSASTQVRAPKKRKIQSCAGAAGSASAKEKRGAVKAYQTRRQARAVARRPGPSPPTHAANTMAGK